MIGWRKKYRVSRLVKRRLRHASVRRWWRRRLLARQGWLTASAVARVAKVSPAAVYKWLAAGAPHKKVGGLVVFKPAKVKAWLVAPERPKRRRSKK